MIRARNTSVEPAIDLSKLTADLIRNYNLADYQYEKLVESIVDFEKDLKEEEEVGARLVSFGQNVTLHITDLGYYNPSLIVFHGINEDGKPMKLIQHVSQISVLLTIVPRRPNSERIGFKLQSNSNTTDDKQE